MFIRQKDGFYAGQIREFPPHIARELIAAGRAVNPFEEPTPELRSIAGEPVRLPARAVMGAEMLSTPPPQPKKKGNR